MNVIVFGAGLSDPTCARVLRERGVGGRVRTDEKAGRVVLG
jgi:hypothetical protein